MLLYVLVMIFPFAMAFAAATDLLTMTIPNEVSVGLVGAFLIAAPLVGISWQDFLGHWAAGAGVLLAGIFLFSMGWLGGGDAKLLAAASLWIGPGTLLMFLATVAALGGALAIAVLAYRRLPAGALPIPDWAARLHARGSDMPYGIAIAAGGLAVYPSTGWYAALGG